MIDKKHVDFFKEVNNTYGNLIQLEDKHKKRKMKDLDIIYDSKTKVITLVCQNPFTKSFAAKITNKNLGNREILSKVDKASECGPWILNQFISQTDLFKLNDGTEVKLEYSSDASSGNNHISFRCDRCYKNHFFAGGGYYALTRSLNLYLKKYYKEKENATEK